MQSHQCKSVCDFLLRKATVPVLCFLLTCYIMFKVTFTFAITKPTSSSQESILFGSETFPDVVVCADPGIDQKVSNQYGYNDSWAFFLGTYGTWDGQFVGWSGIRGEASSTKIFDEMANVKAKQGGLISKTLFYDKDHTYDHQSDEFRMMSLPHYRCQLEKTPKLRWNASGLEIFLNTTNIINLPYLYIEILLLDPVNSPAMFRMSFQMKGTPLKVKVERKYHSYIVKIAQFCNIEGNPQFDCKDYSQDNTFGKCIEDELETKFLAILNCTPPWLGTTSKICNKRLRLEDEEAQNLKQLNQDLYFGKYKSETCIH